MAVFWNYRGVKWSPAHLSDGVNVADHRARSESPFRGSFYTDGGRLFQHYNGPIVRTQLGTDWSREPENNLKIHAVRVQLPDLGVSSFRQTLPPSFTK